MNRLAVPSRPRIIVPSDAWRGRASSKLSEAMDLLRLGFLPQIAGGATGTNQSGDIVTQTADGRDLNSIWAEYQQALAMFNAQRDGLMRVLSYPVTKVIEDVYQGGDLVNFEEASEHGLPRGIRPALPSYFSLGYDFRWYDTGMAFTWEFLADSDVAQVDALNNAMLEADNRNMFMKVFRAVFNNVTRSASINNQNYNVYPIYNGDGTVPPQYKNTVFTAPHTHFLVSGGATVASGDFDDAEAHLKHHGYSWRNGTALVALVNSADMATIRTFRVANGDSYDFIQSAGIPAWALQPEDMIAGLGPGQTPAAPPSSWNGLTVEGRYGPWLLVEEDLVPSKYILHIASGGTEDARNLVGIREHINNSLRGLRLVKGPDPDYPLRDSYYQRGFGTGIRQRGAAVVTQIKASGSYDIPAAYL
jgi:hypothetical protein